MVDKYEKALSEPLYIDTKSPKTSIGLLDKTIGIKILWLGQRAVGTKRVPSGTSYQDKTVYKRTAYIVEFNNGLKVKITPYLFRELKRRQRLNVKKFEYYG